MRGPGTTLLLFSQVYQSKDANGKLNRPFVLLLHLFCPFRFFMDINQLLLGLKASFSDWGGVMFFWVGMMFESVFCT